MKRTPLKRKTPLRRKTWMKRSAKSSSYARRPRDLNYMRLVRRLPCAAANALYFTNMTPTPCEGRVQADHAGDRVFGQKSADDECIPMCNKHHRERTNYFGMFAGWSGTQMKVWRLMVVSKTQRQVRELALRRRT